MLFLNMKHKMLLKTFIIRFIRLCSTKSFKEIPGPKPVPVVGNASVFSDIGNIIKTFSQLREQYGNIVRLKLERNTVLLFDPDDIRTMYQHEGKYPQRPTFEALKRYRKENFDCVGLVPDNGPEWYRLRQQMHHMLYTKEVQTYWEKQRKVAKDFAEFLQQSADLDGEIHNFLHFASLYALEAVGIFCYGQRLGCISSNSEEGAAVARANDKFLNALGRTFYSFPFWKVWKTKAYKDLEESQNFMTNVSRKYLNQAKERLNESDENFEEREPFLSRMIRNRNLKSNEIEVLVTEVFQGGIDATATTISFMLYHLSRNQAIQDNLYNDLMEMECKPGISPPLLRSCLKETLRLNPTASANSRILDSDAVFSGYLVPKGTLAIGVNPVICRMPEYFSSPDKFNPWRWSRENKKIASWRIHPYAVLPFGFGARMCPGRRFAEQEILLCVAELIKKYRIVNLNSEKVGMTLKTNLVPDKPLNFGIVLRK